jgi:antitoxin (DNA-binding transcriptional repressor) of toxin-antitoxin stability system
VVLTERGKPIAVIKPLETSERPSAVIRRLEALGLLRAASHSRPMPDYRPRRMKGAPLTKTLREERDGTR